MVETHSLWAFAPGALRTQLLSDVSGGPPRIAQRTHEAGKVTLVDLTPRVGEAWCPVVREPDARGPRAVRGVLARVSVGGEGRPLPHAQTEAVREWVARLAGRTDTAALQRYDLRLSHVPPEWTVAGNSLTLAAAVALLSAVLGRAVGRRWVLSGALGPGSQVKGVRHLGDKRAICAVEAPDAETMLCETAFDGSPLLRDLFGAGWSADIRACFHLSADERARHAWDLYRQRDYDGAETAALAAVRDAPAEAGALARWVVGACRMHRGQPGSLELIQEAMRWHEQHQSSRQFAAEELTAFLGIALLDHGRADDGEACLRAALSRLETCPGAYRWERWSEVMVQVAGSLRRCLHATDQLESAMAVQAAHALAACTKVPKERARCLLDLGTTQLQAGRLQAARDSLRQAEAALRHASEYDRATTRRYLRIQQVRAGLAPPDERVESPDFGAWPQPIEVSDGLLADDSPGRFDAWVADALAPSVVRPLPVVKVLLYIAARATVRWGPRPCTPALVAAFHARVGDQPSDPTLRKAVAKLGAGDATMLARIAPY